MANSNMHRARKNANDEFYTQISDIEKELRHYREHFKGKTVYMNADDPKESNFWKYFYLNFNFLGLKKIISTHYNLNESTYKLEYEGEGEPVKTRLEGNGDFRSPEAIEILKESDVVVTNPPFSLFREYIKQIIDYDKDFLVIGNMNAITYKEFFPYLKENKIWVGYNNGDMSFKVPEHYEPRKTRFWIDEDGGKWRSMGNISWYTNLDIEKRYEELILYKEYSLEEYPKYDNYNAINVDRVVNIPIDYEGLMGVPITFLTKHNPEQFDIVDGIGRYSMVNHAETMKAGNYLSMIDGKAKYYRIIIKKKQKGGKM